VSDFEQLRSDPRVRPILAPDRLPPSFLAVGSRDPLLEETLAMAKRMAENGRPCELVVYDDAPHGFLQLPFHPAQAHGYDDALRFARRP
jgi:acetyl esterase/lipase